MRKINFLTIILAILLCACSANSSNNNAATNTSVNSKTETSKSSDKNTDAIDNSTKKTDKDAANIKDSSSNNEWPSEFEGKLPKPDCKITDVKRYDEKSMSGKLTIVNFSDMSKENAQKYVEALKNMGFSGGMEINNDKNIIFNGVGKDSSSKNGINFVYNIADKNGSISY